MGHLHVHIHKIHKSPSCQKLKDNRRFSIASGLIQHVVDLPAPAHVVISPAKSTFSRGGNGKYPARPALPAIATMKFWDKIFAPAMRVLARRPRPGPVLPGYDIRSKSNWAEVEQCLENARRRYDGDLRRRRGRFKERCRRIAEHGVVGVQAMRFIKEVEYVSVVMGVVEVLVDVSVPRSDAGFEACGETYVHDERAIFALRLYALNATSQRKSQTNAQCLVDSRQQQERHQFASAPD